MRILPRLVLLAGIFTAPHYVCAAMEDGRQCDIYSTDTVLIQKKKKEGKGVKRCCVLADTFSRVIQQMSQLKMRLMTELVQSEIRHLTRVPATHPSSSGAPHTSPMMKPFLSFTHLHLLTSSIPTLRIISGFFVPPAHTLTAWTPSPPTPPPPPLFLTQTGSCNGWTFPPQRFPGC